MAGEKVSRILSKYDLEDYGAELEENWTHPNPDERKSSRTLAADLNEKLIEQVVNTEMDGMLPVDLSLEELPAALRDSTGAEQTQDVSRDRQVSIEELFRDHGVDVDALKHNLVSHVTMLSYLRDQRNATQPDLDQSPRTPEEHQAKKINRVETHKSHVKHRLENDFKTLRSQSLLPDNTPRMYVDISIECPNCLTEHDAETYIQRQGCTECDAHMRDTPDTNDYQDTLTAVDDDDTATPDESQ